MSCERCDGLMVIETFCDLMEEDRANGAADHTMETAFAWIQRHDHLAIVVLSILGSVDLPIPDEPLLVYVGYPSSKRDLSAPLPTVLCKEAHRCLNV